jgi:spore maturation protein CgeE
MHILNRIIECELEYIKCFSEASEYENIIRFRDNLIQDMYYHNYTQVKKMPDFSSLIWLIESEIHHSKNEGKRYCLIRCPALVDKSISTRFLYELEVSFAGHYIFNISESLGFNGIKDCSIVKVNKTEMLEDMLILDLEHDEDSLGKDFCTRRVYRRKDIYLSDIGVSAYICYHDGKAVGSGNLFLYKHVAKIEDIAVSPQYQRKGFGKTILKYLIETAISSGAEIIYLEADEGDTAKEMYLKCGFSNVNRFTDLLFHI